MLFTDLNRHKGDAGSHVLKGQVETLLCHRPHLPDLGVEPENTIAEVGLCEALICCNGVHLQANNKKFY